eukprot:scaffold2555_cov282-Prasinococcus_capsulatus_cf.AAC.4
MYARRRARAAADRRARASRERRGPPIRSGSVRARRRVAGWRRRSRRVRRKCRANTACLRCDRAEGRAAGTCA